MLRFKREQMISRLFKHMDDGLKDLGEDDREKVRLINGRNGWHVELSHNSKSGGGPGVRGGHGRGGGGGDDMKCYECGEPGHFDRECRSRGGSRALGSGRRRSPSPVRHRRSPSYGRRSYSPRGFSPRGSRSPLPPRKRSISPWSKLQ